MREEHLFYCWSGEGLAAFDGEVEAMSGAEFKNLKPKSEIRCLARARRDGIPFFHIWRRG